MTRILRKKDVKKEFDWFLKADDDTFVIIENLKERVSMMDPQKPYYLISRHFQDARGLQHVVRLILQL